jgi:thymidylate kinase
LHAINRVALVPTVGIVVDVSARVAAERRAARGGSPELFETDSLQVRLSAAYARAEEYLGSDHQVIHLDGERSEDEVYADVETHALRALGVASSGA